MGVKGIVANENDGGGGEGGSTLQISPEAASLKKQAQHKVFTLQIKAFFPLIINIYSNASFSSR